MRAVPIKSLAEIAESVRYGYTASASDAPVGPHFLRITDIVPSQIDWKTVPYCEIDEKDKDRFSLAPGDIVIARTGATVGYAKLIRDNQEAVFASYLVRVRVDPKYADPGYVGRMVESDVYKKFVISRVGGAAQPNANAKVLSAFRLPIPDRTTQARIVEILSAYDDLIENNRRRLQLLEQAARLLYKEWFVHLRFPGHEHVKIKACSGHRSGDGIPEGWEKRTAFDVMDVLSGGTPKTNMPDYWGGEISFFTPKDTTDSAYVFITEKTLTETGLKNCNSKLYPQDTVFITARGTVGNINLAAVPMSMNQSCYALIAKAPLHQVFLYFAIKESVEQFRSRAVGTVFDAIICDTFKLIPFVVPEEKLVRLFTDYAGPLLRQIHLLMKQTQKLVQARDLLLPRLMNGEIAA
jgi:type I restriction enzyme S subunit